MSVKVTSTRKVTISLPETLMSFADREAARLNISRSRLIARALGEMEATEQERPAAEGYRFYAREAAEYAEASAGAAVEAWEHAGWAG